MPTQSFTVNGPLKLAFTVDCMCYKDFPSKHFRLICTWRPQSDDFKELSFIWDFIDLHSMREWTVLLLTAPSLVKADLLYNVYSSQWVLFMQWLNLHRNKFTRIMALITICSCATPCKRYGKLVMLCTRDNPLWLM